MKIFEIILLEDRADYIAQSMKKGLEDAAKADPALKRLGPESVDSVKIVQQLKAMDPDAQGRNLQFLANMYSRNQFSLEDRDKMNNAITMFLRFRNQLPVKDLNSIKSLDQLYDLIEPLEQQAQQAAAAGAAPEPVSKRQQERQIKSDVEVLLDSPNLKVIVPKTEDASCLYGKGTRWCTAGNKDNMFGTYSKQGPLYILLANLGGKQRKFQVHYESDQFMNERDQAISAADIRALSKLPEYKEFLDYLIKLHYGKWIKA